MNLRPPAEAPARHHLASRPDTVRFGRLPTAGAAPVLACGDGDVVTIDTVSHEGLLEDQGADPVAFFGALGIPADEVLADARAIAEAGLPHVPGDDGPHIVTGPVAVTGAEPGTLLAVDVLALERRAAYGIVSNRHGRGVLAGELPATRGESVPGVVSHLARVLPDGRHGALADERGRVLPFPLRPFLGLMAVAPVADEEPSSTPPGGYGGNLDVACLGIGSTLYLPVQAPGGLFSCGDPHYAQGNGEVALTAFEAPLRARLALRVEAGADARRLAGLLAHPFGETAHHLVAIGLGATLDGALAAAVRNALSLVVERTGVARETALAFLSVAGSFEVSQAVNGVRGVHCRIERVLLERCADEDGWPAPFSGPQGTFASAEPGPGAG